MQHFNDDNTSGYTAEQLASANRQIDAWCEVVGITRVSFGHATTGDGEDMSEEYSEECSRVLARVEA